MKKPLLVMLSIIVLIVILAGGGVGTYMYLHHHKAGTNQPLTPAQAASLQFTLPQMTTNLKSQGLIQFTLTLQADNKKTEKSLQQMQNQIEDSINEIMRQFAPDQLRDDKGLNALKNTVLTTVNQMLQTGRVTNVYFSQVLVQ